jgi:hypothetical protein
MSFQSGRQIGVKLCEIFGLDCSVVSSIDLHVDAGSVVTATFKVLVKDELNDRITGELKTVNFQSADTPGLIFVDHRHQRMERGDANSGREIEALRVVDVPYDGPPHEGCFHCLQAAAAKTEPDPEKFEDVTGIGSESRRLIRKEAQ